MLFAVTLSQHSPLTRRVFFISIRRERYASSIASGGQYRQYHVETLSSAFTSHRKFSSSETSSFSKECHHHLHQYVSIKWYLITVLGWHITVLHWLNVIADKLVAQCQSHLDLCLTTRLEARYTSSSWFTSNNKVRSKESSFFMSNN